MRVTTFLASLGLALPAMAGDLTGIWRIDRIGDLSLGTMSEPGRDEVEIDGDRFRARLACAYVEGGVVADRPSRDGVTGDWLKCPSDERAAAQILVDILAHPDRVSFLLGDTLTLRTPDGAATIWTRLPGSSGPPEALNGVLGNWRIAAIDGMPPLPGLETDKPLTVVIEPFRVGGYAGCNGGGADILWTDNGYVSRGPVVATAMLCEPLMDQEIQVFTIFAGPTRIEARPDGWRLVAEAGGSVDLVPLAE